MYLVGGEGGGGCSDSDGAMVVFMTKTLATQVVVVFVALLAIIW